jgi:hypothetical protein
MENINAKKQLHTKIILLSLARMNGTIITRSFAQLVNSKIYNEITTHFYSTKGYVDFNTPSTEEELLKIKDMIQLANDNDSNGFISIFHEMAGDFKRDQIQILKDAGFIFILVIRDPRKQFASLQRLSDDKNFRNNLEGGWVTIDEMLEQNIIDGVIFSEKYLLEEAYRKAVLNDLGHLYHDGMANNMTECLGKDFHDICTITKSWDNSNNLWNGPPHKKSSFEI